MALCGGSATDLPIQIPYLAQFFNNINSFDTQILMRIMKQLMKQH